MNTRETLHSQNKQQAEQLLQQGNLSAAKILAQKCCEELPDDAESHFLLAAILRNQGNLPAAIEQLKQTVKLRPDTFFAHCNLGIAYNQAGDFEKGEKSLKAALALEPENSNAITHLAFSIIQQQRYPEAEKLLLNTDGASLPAAEVSSGLGLICIKQQRFKEAISHYERACTLAPGRTGFWLHLGNAQLRQGDIEKAIKSYEEVLKVEPDNPHALARLGHAWTQSGDIEKAISSYKKSLAISGTQNNAIAELADLYEHEGRFEEAYQLILSAINGKISDTRIAITFVRLGEQLGHSDKAIDYAESVLTSTDITPQNESHLRYALGRYYDSVCNYPEAFKHYKRANESDEVQSDDTLHSRIIDSLIKHYNADFFRNVPQASNKSEQPVFVIGMPRSGTTLTEQILASHPVVYGAGELTILNDITRSLKTGDGTSIHYPSELSRIDNEAIDLAAIRYLDYISNMSPDSARIIDKMPDNFIHLGLISKAFPNARIIHCTRNPLDLCLSIYFQDFSGTSACTTNLAAIARHYMAYQKYIKYIKQATSLNMIDVAYEDLVSNQKKTSKAMIDFLGLEWDDACLKFHKNKRFVATPSYHQVRKKMYSSSVNRWKNYEAFIPELLDMFE